MFLAIFDYLSSKYSGKVFTIVLRDIFRDALRELLRIREPSFEEFLWFSENRVQMFLKSCWEVYNYPYHFLDVIDISVDYGKLEEEFLDKFF